jgi:hypothetical protein
MNATVSSAELDDHLERVRKLIQKGRIVPFLGAGANLCDQSEAVGSTLPDSNYPPSCSQLARTLARRFCYPDQDCHHNGCPMQGKVDPDLMRVAQYAELHEGVAPLYEELRGAFQRKFQLTSVHKFLAGLPGPSQPDETSARQPLVVTTNYDDLMEQAFNEAGREFDLVFYKPYCDSDEGVPWGRFWHRAPGGQPEPIWNGSDYPYAFLTKRPVILKIHGTVYDPVKHDGFVITEDDYIEYLSEEPLSGRLPAILLQKLRKNYLLFLGYSLRDWNLRVFLWRLRRNPKDSYMSWAVQLSADETDRRFWAKHDVEIVSANLAEYVHSLQSLTLNRS